ncbi:hypothetical protein HJG60_009028 [Phyllostomus discolor]|uniref:Uncharacterized protein n=1 Tax=Phyllostomus discolor TaxID=89673 RepID=A0A833YF58_9CHIR|nr:hypothetical protein HJG60_009028 [Phyllostomus discolor]
MCCTSSSPSCTPIIWMLECFKMSWRFRSLSSFVCILISSFYSDCMCFSSFLQVHSIDVSPRFFPSLFPCAFFFISFSVAFIFSSTLRPKSTNSLSILITSALNCAPDRLAISWQLKRIGSGV